MLAAFTYRDFRVQWFGACSSSIGTWTQLSAQNWMVLSLTGSAFFLGLDAFLQQLPIMLFTLIGGVLADRRDRRRTLLTSQYIQMATATMLALLVYSGVVESGSQVINATKGKKERLGKLFQMHSNKENPVDAASAGHIYAMIGLKDTTTGDTLCDPQDQVVLESMTFPDPVINVAIEPKTKGDQEKLGTAIQRLAEEDPTFQVELDQETGQTIIKGMGELHLDILVDRMKREFNVEANVGKPQVAYRETIRRPVEKLEYTHKKQTGGSGQYAKVQVTIEPLDTSDGELYEFENKVTGGRIPREYIPSVDHGIQDAMQYGVLAGYPLVGLKATLLDGQYGHVEIDLEPTGPGRRERRSAPPSPGWCRGGSSGRR